LPYRGWISATPAGDELPVQRQPERNDVPGYRQGRKVYASKMQLAQDDSDSVWNLQVALIARGFEFEDGPTAYYGRHTRRCVAAFQHRRGWEGKDADGIAGPQTIARLGLVWVDG
jgi:peptidoglycan hydrolase-like protein with peptidoglycan-binding domain